MRTLTEELDNQYDTYDMVKRFFVVAGTFVFFLAYSALRVFASEGVASGDVETNALSGSTLSPEVMSNALSFFLGFFSGLFLLGFLHWDHSSYGRQKKRTNPEP
ncbi:MAG TPA: hypothetical protein VJ179_04005 [Patescibacteria group bacterium]|nr:hypothetical protein [Patescibacteria group bacterium]